MLYRLVISGPLLKWFKSYLTDRVCRVSLNSIISGPLYTGQIWVLQCSMLGSLFFLIYVNDNFTVATPSRLLLFANGSQCFRCIRHLSDCSVLQGELGPLSAGAKKWGVKFNMSKNAHIRFGSSFPNTNFAIDNSLNTTTTCSLQRLDVSDYFLAVLYSSPQQDLSKAYRSLGLIRTAVPKTVTLT